MKKLFLLLALAGVMVACGGEQKKDEKKNDATEQKAEAKAPATMVEFAEAMLAAAEAGDVEKYVELEAAYEKFAEGLKEDELKKQVKEWDAWMKDEKNKEDIAAVLKFETEKAKELAEERAKLEKK